MNNTRYRKAYSPGKFWRKLSPGARGLSRFVLEKALFLYYALQSPATPKWARRVMIGALGYFIFPLDAFPDLLPMVGYTDDVMVMAAALTTVAFYITPEVKAQARSKLLSWLGPDAASADA